MKYEDLQYLAVQLPEDILKEKWSGHFERARAIIADRMEKDIPYALKCRLKLELGNMADIERRYTVTKEEALAQVRNHIPDMSEEEFDRLLLEGKIDWAYIEGEQRYLDSFCATLFKVYPKLWERSVIGDKSDYSVLEDLVQGLTDGQETSCHIHIRQTLSVKEEAVEEGKTLHAYMPLPVEREQIKNLNIIDISPAPKHVSEASAPQPTVYFEEPAKAGMVFSIEYAFDHVVNYIDMEKVNLSEVATAEIPEEEKKYLAEELPHIQFSPYLRALAEELKGDETNPLLIARRFYDFITTKTEYRFVRDYSCIDNLPEYCALNQKGDCGVQALLFITLCRIAGIPARWQSGIDAKPGDIGEHDWAMFYVPSLGWRYADLSYGGSSYVRGAYARWNYFFGNADPYRIPINAKFQQNFDIPKKFRRQDPYDNQVGELEYDDHGVYGSSINYRYEEIDIHRIK